MNIAQNDADIYLGRKQRTGILRERQNKDDQLSGQTKVRNFIRIFVIPDFWSDSSIASVVRSHLPSSVIDFGRIPGSGILNANWICF